MEGLLCSPYAWVILIVTLVVICFSYMASVGTDEWYESLIKPWGVVPNSVFGIVWAVLYVLIVIGGVIGVMKYKGDKAVYTLVHLIIIGLTLAWIYAFSEYHMMSFAMAILLLTVLFTLIILYMNNPKSTGHWVPFLCYIPFLIWILVASYYNLGFLWLNPEKDEN